MSDSKPTEISGVVVLLWSAGALLGVLGVLAAGALQLEDPDLGETLAGWGSFAAPYWVTGSVLIAAAHVVHAVRSGAQALASRA